MGKSSFLCQSASVASLTSTDLTLCVQGPAGQKIHHSCQQTIAPAEKLARPLNVKSRNAQIEQILSTLTGMRAFDPRINGYTPWYVEGMGGISCRVAMPSPQIESRRLWYDFSILRNNLSACCNHLRKAVLRTASSARLARASDSPLDGSR
jgi:hypothetical protein